MRRVDVVAVFVLIALAMALLQLRASKTLWNPDSYNYSIRAQMYHGIPYLQARRSSQAYFATLAVSRDPQYRFLFRGNHDPQYWRQFAPRILYPYVASLLWGKYGFQSLIVVSMASYIVAAILLFALLRRFVEPAPALIGALIFIFSRQVVEMSNAALTDMPAIALWIATFYTMCRFVEGPSLQWFAAYVVCAAALCFTRPVPYLPLCAAAGLLAVALHRNDVKTARVASWLCAGAVVCAAAITATAVLLHSPGFGGILHAGYELERVWYHIPAQPLWLWYIKAIIASLLMLAYSQIAAVVPVLGVLGFVAIREDKRAPLFFGGLGAIAVGVLLNPVMGSVTRTAALPLYPIFICGLAIVVSATASAPVKRMPRARASS